MTDRMEVLAFREYTVNGEKRTAKTKVGMMFRHRQGGEGWTITLDAIPAPQDGQFRLVAFPPQPKQDRAGYGAMEPEERGPVGIDDDIPF